MDEPRDVICIELETRKDHIALPDVLTVFAAAEWTKCRSVDRVKKMLDHANYVVMAKVGRRPVGFARLITDEAFRGFVEDVMVIPQMRQQGIGKRMMDVLEAMARKLALPRLELTTRETGFWEKLGYMKKEGSTSMVKSLTVR